MMRVNRMTPGQFFQEEEHYVQGVRKEVGEHYVQKAKALLIDRPFCFREETALKVARGVVINGEILRSNADAESDDDDDETEQINAIGQEYSRSNQIALVCIEAPSDKGGKPLEVDEKTRDMQFEKILNLHPMLKEKRRKISTGPKKVYNYEAMKDAIEGFIAMEGTSAYVATVMFNGHGSENGLIFHEHREGEETPLDLFIADFRQVVDKYRSAENFNMPGKVQVIFGQCYGHKHTDPNIPNFTIYSFTSDREGEERTYVCDSKDALSQDVTDSHHHQLEEHAQNQEALWKLPTTKVAAIPIEEPGTSIGIEEEEAMDFDTAL